MAVAGSPFELIRHPLAIRRAHVASAEYLTPKVRRIRLVGPDLSSFVSLAPEDHVKVFFPTEEGQPPALPRLEDGRIVRPRTGRLHARDYTPADFDPKARQLDIDFYLHGEGVAARWAARARQGDVLGVAGPRGSFVLRRHFERHVVLGDETAIPEFRRRIAALPHGTPIHAICLVDGPDERQELPSEVEVHWLFRRELGDRMHEAIVAELERLKPHFDQTFFWLASEVSEVRTSLSHLLSIDPNVRARLRSSGHWKRGVPDHDHHQPVEVA